MKLTSWMALSCVGIGLVGCSGMPANNDGSVESFEQLVAEAERNENGEYVVDGELHFANIDELADYYQDARTTASDVELGSTTAALTAAPWPPLFVPTFSRCENNEQASYLVEVVPAGDIPASRYVVDKKSDGGTWINLYDGPNPPFPRVTMAAGASVYVRAQACNAKGCSDYRTTSIKGKCTSKGETSSGNGKNGGGKTKLPKVPGPGVPIHAP